MTAQATEFNVDTFDDAWVRTSWILVLAGAIGISIIAIAMISIRLVDGIIPAFPEFGKSVAFLSVVGALMAVVFLIIKGRNHP